MKKKRILIIAIIFIIIVIPIIFYFLSIEEPAYIYSDDPKTWVEEKDGVKKINIDKVTRGEGYVDFNGLQLRHEEIETVFDYEGFYKGDYFRREYVDENGKILMKVTPDIKPNDGIIEGFMIEKFENNELVVYIFLDEDWKRNIGNTNIFWGKSYEFDKEFSFNLISEGIYMDKIIDVKERFSDDLRMHFGAVIVGDLARDDDVNATLIRLV